jgi:hypothetical protein
MKHVKYALIFALTAPAWAQVQAPAPAGAPAIANQSQAGSQLANPNNLRQNLMIPGLSMPLMTTGPQSDINITETNIGQLMDAAMKEHFRVRIEDAKFFKEQLQQLETSFLKLNNLVTGTGAHTYTQMVNDSVNGNYPKSDEFLKVRSEIVNMERAIKVKIGTVRAFNSGALPSARISVSQSKDVEIPGQYNLNFNPIADFYDGQFKLVEEYINGQSLFFFDKLGKRIAVTGVNFDASGITLLLEKDIKEKQREIKLMKSNGADAEVAQDALTKELIAFVKLVLQLNGTDTRFRYNPKAEVADRDQKLARLQEGLLFKSYQRLKYRMPVGTFFVRYKPLTLNRDELKFDPKDYIENFLDVSVRRRDQEEETVTNFTRAVFSGSLRRGEEQSFLIGSVLHSWDFLRGWNTLSKVGLEIFRLLYADAKEDLSMNTGDGVENFEQTFQQRYLSNPENKARVLTSLCSIDPDKVKCPNGKNASLGQIDNQGSFRGLTQKAIMDTNVRAAVLKQANDLQITLDEMVGLQKSGVGQQIDDNLNILK